MSQQFERKDIKNIASFMYFNVYVVQLDKDIGDVWMHTRSTIEKWLSSTSDIMYWKYFVLYHEHLTKTNGTAIQYTL